MRVGPSADEVPVVSVEEASERLGVSPATVKRWCQEGVLSARKLGRQWLIDEASVERQSPRRPAPYRPPKADLDAAFARVRDLDLRETASVPDVLLYRDLLEQRDEILGRAAELLDRSRPPVPPVEVEFPKSPFFSRTLCVLELEERIAYEAAVATLSDRIDQSLPPVVFGGRRTGQSGHVLRRSLEQWHQWRRAVIESIRAGSSWMIKTDITAFFDTVQHRMLFSDIDGLNPDARIATALKEMLRTWAAVPGLGLPQGPDASRVLANAYFLPVDHAMVMGPWAYYRFMDDIRILAGSRHEALQGLRILERECKKRALVLSANKTELLSDEEALGDWEDVELATAQYHLDSHSWKPARRYLNALLRRSLSRENALDTRAARFSLSRLHGLKDKALISFVLSRLEDLAPLPSLVATFLHRWIAEERVVSGLESFFNDPGRNTSPVLTAWILAACLDHPGPVPVGWAQYARSVALDRNQPSYLRAVAMSVAAQFRPFLDPLRRAMAGEHDPAVIRGLIVALARVESLDRMTRETATHRAPNVRATVIYLTGRTHLPSLIDRDSEVEVRHAV